MAWLKFWPMRRRYDGQALTITYPAVDLDFEKTVLARLKREGYKRIKSIESKRVKAPKKTYTKIVVLKSSHA